MLIESQESKADAKMIYKRLVELKLRSFKPYLPEGLDLCRGLLILVEIMHDCFSFCIKSAHLSAYTSLMA